jgi:hypothetical protein
MVDPQLMQSLQRAGNTQNSQVDPNNPMHAMLLGAVASEMLKPKRVKNLEAFISQYPEVGDMVAQALGKPVPKFGADQVGKLYGLAGLLGGMNAKAEPGPKQGPEQEYQ